MFVAKSQRSEMHSVLVIDSDPASAKKIDSALTGSGFEVMVASSELAGLKIVDKAFPDAVVVRDSPPRLDSFTLCWQIHRLFNLPLILLDDKSEEEVYSPTFEVRADWDYYMHLPINYDELTARIRVLLWRYGKAELPHRNDKRIKSMSLRGLTSQSIFS